MSIKDTKQSELIISDINVTNWSLPLLAPFRVATRTATDAGNVLIRIFGDDGTVGFGAAAPVDYITGESQLTVITALTKLAPLLLGQRYDSLLSLLQTISRELSDQPAARAGIEMALYDLWAKHWKIPLWRHFGGSDQMLQTDITIPIVCSDDARVLVREALSNGFKVFKIKIGDSDGHDADFARIAAVRESAPGARLRIDANQAFEPPDAVEFVRRAQKLTQNIELVEQPVPKSDYIGLKYVKEHVDVPVFADESARSLEQVKTLIEMSAVDGINVKLMKSGISEAVEIARLCKRSNIKLMIGCMLESPLGIAAAASIAGGLGGFEFVDLDSHKLLKPVISLRGGFSGHGSTLELCPNSAGWGIDFTESQDGTNT